MKNPPPKFAESILLWFAKDAFIEDLLGDLYENFYNNTNSKGLFKARILFNWQVLKLLFSYGFRNRKMSAAYSHYYVKNSFSMIQNYFKIAIRNFLKHKLFTSINVLGLALGMSICLLALSISVSIFQSDRFHEKKDRIYQVNTFIEDKNGTKTYGSTYPAVSSYLNERYSFIEKSLRLITGFKPTFRHQGTDFDFHGYYADPDFFNVFSFRLIRGNPRTALENPYSLVITKSIADKLFRDQDPIGKALETANGSFTVTGVMDDLKETHLYFEILTSTKTISQNLNSASIYREHRNNYLYLLLKENTSPASLDEALKSASGFIETYNENQSIHLESVLLEDAVPRWNISQAIGIGWDYPSMIFFMFIGFLILLPAIFNYTNLSIARALKRSKEVGVRKVMGANRTQIKNQFIVETILLSIIALGISMLFFIPIQAEFLNMVRAAEVLNTSIRTSLIIVFILFAILIGIFSGLFPALYFSRLNPIHSLKGDFGSRGFSISGIKKGLFVFQFGLSLFFMIGVGTIAKQYRHALTTSHGFNHKQILTVPFGEINKQVALQEMLSNSGVVSATAASSLPGIVLNNSVMITPNNVDTIPVGEIFIGDDFVENMDMELLWGDPKDMAVSNLNVENVLVNEQYFKSISVFPNDKDSLEFILEDGSNVKIVGVIKNLFFEPLSEKVRPILFRRSLEKS